MKKTTLIKALLGLIESRDDDDYGICFNLSSALGNGHAYTFMETAPEGWEHHSGDIPYPVPHETGSGLWEGKDLELRTDLIHYIVKRIESGELDELVKSL